MMSSQTLRVLSSIASRSSRAARQSNFNATNISRAAFSAQPEASLTPGIGLGKTSTGLVSFVTCVFMYVIVLFIGSSCG